MDNLNGFTNYPHRSRLVIDGNKQYYIYEDDFSYLKDFEKRYNKIIIGNIDDKTYHLFSCKSIPKDFSKIIIFNSIEEAEDNGYKFCKDCNQ